jgi:hypothetical protein
MTRVRAVHASGDVPGRGGRVGMTLFGAFPIAYVIVFSVVVTVMGWFSCRVYTKSGRMIHHPSEDKVTVRPFFYFAQKSSLVFSASKRFVQRA